MIPSDAGVAGSSAPDDGAGEQLTLVQSLVRGHAWAEEAHSHMTQDQKDWWLAVVWDVARKYKEFTTNEVIARETQMAIEKAEQEPGASTWDYNLIEKRALGGVMKRAQTIQLIEPTERFTPDRTPGAHGRPKRIWASLVYRGDDSWQT